MSDETQAQVQIEHRFKAAPTRVFDAWLDPEMIRQWMLGSRIRNETVLQVRTDPRAGGAFLFSVERNEQIFEYVGEYFLVDRPNRLVFTWALDQNATESDHVIVDFRPEGTGCHLTLVHNLHAGHADQSDDVLSDWPKMLDVLEKVLANR